ncbi:hypothetical protein L916_17051, partial [Phytophthora nicotianae]
ALLCHPGLDELNKLKAEKSKEDHGSERDGAYTTHAMHQALQKR